MTRQAFKERKLYLVSQVQRDTLLALIPTLPLDSAKPLEVVIREKQRVRKLDQNALYHAGPLKDIADHGWIEGQQFSAASYHEFFKRNFLPEDTAPEADPINGYVKDGYRKYEQTLDGGQHLVGSTTQLTVRGFSDFLEQVFAFGSSLGVQFSANPKDGKL